MSGPTSLRTKDSHRKVHVGVEAPDPPMTEGLGGSGSLPHGVFRRDVRRLEGSGREGARDSPWSVPTRPSTTGATGSATPEDGDCCRPKYVGVTGTRLV